MVHINEILKLNNFRPMLIVDKECVFFSQI